MSSDDEMPLARVPTKKRKRDLKIEDDEDEIPLAKVKKDKKEKKDKLKDKKKQDKPKLDKPKVDKSDKPKTPKKAKDSTPIVKVKESPSTVAKVKQPKEETPDDSFRWWEQEDLNGEIKWQTMQHSGVIFPPEYEPLPSFVKLYYDGSPVEKLPLAAEEVAGFFAAMIESDHAKNPVFQKNFFEDFLQVLRECRDAGDPCSVDIEEFEKCDFSKIYAHFEMGREAKKNLTKDEKKRIKEEKELLEEPYKTCLLNGHKETVGNFRIEPPGLFRGRGAHPKTGKLKRRVYPEDITLNLGREAVVPAPPAGHNWGEVRHDNTVAWLATWKENIADSVKYVRFAANSSVKGVSDFKKFETARNLKNHIEEIRKDYTKMLKSEIMQNRQMATATYLIDKFALRAGGEKGDDEADTVGCCSLRYEHISLKPPNVVIFDFLGKDSIRFYQEVEVDKQVFKNLRIFKKAPKQPGDDLFDRINPSTLNKHFQNYMKGLTAKVFRTYNASKTMQDQLDLIENSGSVAEKVLKFNSANRTVAILCNHQRTVSKNHGSLVSKIQDKIREYVWQKTRLKKMMLSIEPSLKKDVKYFAEIEDFSKEDEAHVHRVVIERQLEQLHKKILRDNEKLKLEAKPPLTEEVIKDRYDKIDELKAEYSQELKTGPEVKNGVTVAKLKTQVEAIENRIISTTLQLKDKEDNSEVSLGTSKINYIDPRLSVMFSKRFDVPIERLFTKTLREKFKWAIESVGDDWRF